MNIALRNIEDSDYDYIISNLDSWWGGRRMTDMLPRLFFKNFNDSSFVAINEKTVLGFLIGFKSQSVSETGYIHFVGIDPEFRGRGVARLLYNHFFDYCKSKKINTIQCVTSPTNTKSIEYHHALGFKASEYASDGECVSVSNYDGVGEDRVLFTKII